MYRPQIKVLDCTVRDGGLMNEWRFDDAFVRGVWRACCAAGIDYMEIGYRASKRLYSTKEFGPWRFCDEADVRRVTEDIPGPTKLSIMVDVGRVEAEDFLPASESVISMVRVATYVKDADKAIHLANMAADLGYETTINIMAISNVLERDLDEALEQMEAETRVQAVYIVDSFGALYSEQIHHLVEKYQSFLKTKEVGIHCHNNQQLAFANTIEAIIKGANYLDATLYGIGRAAGNCPLELLMSFLKNPKFDIRPLLDACSRLMLPLAEQIEWGYHIPYMITGVMNAHPRAAMALLKSGDRNDFRRFWEELFTDDDLA